MNQIRRVATTLAAALIIALAGASSVFAHHVLSLSGTVDCDGNYTVNVSANVYGRTSLITTLNGDIIGTEFPGGGTEESDNFGNHDFMYVGSGAEAGDPITAKVSDSETITTAYLVLTQEVCVTEPPVTEPPVTEPPVTQPPVTEPPTTEPPVTEPPTTEPPTTRPPVLPSFPAPSLPNTSTAGAATPAAPDSGVGMFILIGALAAFALVLFNPRRAPR